MRKRETKRQQERTPPNSSATTANEPNIQPKSAPNSNKIKNNQQQQKLKKLASYCEVELLDAIF
jgi:hypothetical protein